MPTGGTQEQNLIEIKTGASKDGTIKVIINDGVKNWEVLCPVKSGDDMYAVVNKLMVAINAEAGEDYDGGRSGQFTWITEPSPVADKNVTITLQDPDSTGVTIASREQSKGVAGTGGVAEVNELEITQVGATASTIEVVFTANNPYLNEKVTVSLNGTETTSDIATKIADAFNVLNSGKGIKRQSVSVSGSKVLFTSTKLLADKSINITLTNK